MKQWELFIAAAALVTGLWAQLKSVFHWAQGFIVATRWVDSETARMVVSYVNAHGARTAREIAYLQENVYVRSLGRVRNVVYEDMKASGGVLWLRHRPLWLTRHKDGRDGRDLLKNSISFIRGTVDFEQLLITACAWQGASDYARVVRHRVHYHHGKSMSAHVASRAHEDETPDAKYANIWARAHAKRPLGYDADDLGGVELAASFDELALSDELLTLVDEMTFFSNSKKWYLDHRLPWRRGYAFVGPPGVGKTSLVRAYAEERDLPVHIFDLASMSNEDLRDAWTEMQADVPCVALIEDVDAVFKGRESVAKGGGLMNSGGLTFDCLLNCIDGVERANGVMLIMTTNHVEHIDAALIDRPGRIDRIVVFKSLDFATRLRVAKRILGDVPEAARLAQESPDVAAAVFVEACCSRALAKLYTAPKADTVTVHVELRKEVL